MCIRDREKGVTNIDILWDSRDKGSRDNESTNECGGGEERNGKEATGLATEKTIEKPTTTDEKRHIWCIHILNPEIKFMLMDVSNYDRNYLFRFILLYKFVKPFFR